MAESSSVQVRVNLSQPDPRACPDFPTTIPSALMPPTSSITTISFNARFPSIVMAIPPRYSQSESYCDPSRNDVADLSWHGPSYAVPGYTNAYFKQNNLLENDWSDVIDLIAVLNGTNGYRASNYVADVQRRLNVDEWMRYMAVNTLLDNDEHRANGAGDDYALYRGTEHPPPGAPPTTSIRSWVAA